jgi:aspartyl aminopeptidase
MAVETVKKELLNAGFTHLKMEDAWQLKPNGKYFVVKNDTAVFAFVVGEKPFAESGVHIIASHSDSPCFKIKPNAEIYGEGGVVRLNVEKYGGGIMYTWFDRPLSVSGRVMLRGKDPLHPEARIIDLKKPIATIPHLAIHFNRAVNEGNPLSVQKDMLPVVGYFSSEETAALKARGGVVKSIVATHLNIEPAEILDYELSLYPTDKADIVGVNNEYFQSGRIDDLSMAFASLEAMLRQCDKHSDATRVIAIFDNEETGSGTKQGAHSPILKSILRRVSGDEESYIRGVATSFMVSADDAHAWHPNYNEKYDPTNHPVMGGGPVVKINANCKYMTDAHGAAVFHSLCEAAEEKCQYFVNHSDVAGGSTLGNILTAQIDIAGVDVGNAIWAMHSARETASVKDHISMVNVFEKFFSL